MLVILILFLSLSSNLYSEQILRGNLDSQDGGSLLYRIEDADALAEIKLICSRDAEFIPSRFILETEQFQFGSFRPTGMWKYIAMESLLSYSALKDSPGLIPDRSSRKGLENPAASYLYSDRAGVFIKTGEEYLQSALWASFYPGNYTTLNTGLSFVLPDGNPENLSEDSWYIDSGIRQYSPLYHSVTEFSTERSRTSYRLITALSSSSIRVPGCSILPVFNYYGPFWDLSSRIWYNSEGWLNSDLERADSQFLWESSYFMKLESGLHLQFKWYTAADYKKETPLIYGIQFRGDKMILSCPSLFEYKLLPPDTSSVSGEDSWLYNHVYRLQTSWNGKVWSSKLEAAIKHDREKIQEWKGSVEVQRVPFLRRYSRLRCSFKSIPGLMSIKPGLEESFSLGEYRVKAAAVYLIELPAEAAFNLESLKLTVSLEWKKD
jgi:hypothetical protein